MTKPSEQEKKDAMNRIVNEVFNTKVDQAKMNTIANVLVSAAALYDVDADLVADVLIKIMNEVRRAELNAMSLARFFDKEEPLN